MSMTAWLFVYTVTPARILQIGTHAHRLTFVARDAVDLLCGGVVDGAGPLL